MSENSEAVEEIYLAPETELSEEDLTVCKSLAIYYEKHHANIRWQQAQQLEGLHPEIETASALGHVASLHTSLEMMRAILVECIEDRPEFNDLLLQLSTTIGANQSIVTQLYNVLLNVYEVQQQILSSEESVNAFTGTIERMVQKQIHQHVNKDRSSFYKQIEQALEDSEEGTDF